ncbi:hypothetical protein JCM9279_005880 [Rhodotorula babjevae]
MPAEPVAQPCEVCGVETTQRCSSCLEAGIDLFFCSKDHQKLVWPAHKTVCGPGKAHPFAVTPLSQDELATLTDHLDDAPYDGDACMGAQLEAVSGERAEVLLNHLSSPTDGSSEASRWIRSGMGTGNPRFQRALASWAGFGAEASRSQVPGV